MDWRQKWMNFQTWRLGQAPTEPFCPPQNTDAIHDVLREWQQAYAFWQMVGDPDLIDVAIFRINAAEKQYIYLLKQEEKRQEKRLHPELTAKEQKGDAPV